MGRREPVLTSPIGLFLRRQGLWIVKMMATTSTGLLACFVAGRAKESGFNIFMGLFVLSLFCFLPLIRMTVPAAIVGYCWGPFFFAPLIQGGSDRAFIGGLMGAMFGAMIGISWDLWNRPNRAVDDEEANDS